MSPEQSKLIGELFYAHFNKLELGAIGYLRSKSMARVAVQEAFHIACEKADVLEVHPNPLGWMRLTVKNVCRNMQRAKRRQLQFFISLDDLTDRNMPTTVDNLDGDPLDAFADLTTDQERTLLRRIFMEGESYVNLAEDLNISMWACYKRVQRTIKKLQARPPP